MADDWRVCIGFGDLPRSSLDSFRQAVTTALSSRLGDQVTVISNATRNSDATQIFLYAPSIGLADEAAQVAREVLAQRNISVSTVQTEGWNWREQEWRDADEMQVEPEVDANGLPVPRPSQAASTDYRLAVGSLVCGIVPLGLALIPIESHKHSGFLGFGFIPALAAVVIGAKLSRGPDKRLSRIGGIAVALGFLGAVALWWAAGWHGGLGGGPA